MLKNSKLYQGLDISHTLTDLCHISSYLNIPAWKSYIRRRTCRPSCVRVCVCVTLRWTPLDSETGLIGDFWSKTYFLKRRKKCMKIPFFPYVKTSLGRSPSQEIEVGPLIAGRTFCSGYLPLILKWFFFFNFHFAFPPQKILGQRPKPSNPQELEEGSRSRL